MNKTLLAVTTFVATLMASLATFNAQAQIAGHNVILVHGFQSTDLQSKPNNSQIKANGASYWASTNYWLENSEARLDWGSDGRIEGKIATQVYDQAVELSQSGLCANGCVMVTHSTGDLVTRYFLAHQEDWLAAAGLQPLNIIAVLDFAGAGGGTEAADVAVAVANGDSNWFNTLLVSTIFGGVPTTEELGVINDLQPAVARSLGNEPKQIPHLRYVGSTNSITSGYLLGDDDGVVPAHSTCASVRVEAINSCSNSVAFDGERTSVKGPTGLRSYHYPVVMGKGISHSDTIADITGNKMTYALNNFTTGLSTQLSTYTADEKPWYQWWGSEIHQYVSNSENQSMTQVVVNSLSN